MARAREELGWLGAIINAICGKSISYYPRFRSDDGRVEKIDEAAIVEQISRTLGGLAAKPEELESHLDRGRESLDEVKGLTEYQDQKATRLLTIVTFLSAFSGVLFARFIESYPLRPGWKQFGFSLEGTGIVMTYVLFWLFAICAGCGALLIFHSTRTTFKYPSLDADRPGQRRLRTKSYLFYSSIIEVRPTIWAESFLKPPSAETEERAADSDLGSYYLKNYIMESYLVAAKVADKLRYLQPAQSILAFSIRVLLFWLVAFGLAVALVPGKDEWPPRTAAGGTILLMPYQMPVSGMPSLVSPGGGFNPSSTTPIQNLPQSSR